MSAVDDLILNLITTQRRATSQELAIIVAHVAQAPFATRLTRVPTKVRTELNQLGITLPVGKVSAVTWHLLKRIYLDEQWPVGVTEAQLVADLHEAVLHRQAHIWTYHYYSQAYAGFLSPSHVQHVPRPEQYIFVAYSATFGTIATGYQASSIVSVFNQGFTDIVQHR